MVFSSLLFVFLFLSFNLLSQIVLKKTEYKNAAMLAFSILFYCWAGPVYFLLLLFDTFVCWGAARLIENSGKTDRKILLAFAVFAVLLVLGIFKYTGFVCGTLQSIFGFPSEVISIALPVGISFYSFQLISYVADVYRGQVAAQKKFWVLLLYACLFHQCIAGPIVRYSDVEKDILTRRVNRAEIGRGISRFTVGLAKKAVLANSCAAVADLFFDKTAAELAKTPALGLWLAGFAFMLQIYLDIRTWQSAWDLCADSTTARTSTTPTPPIPLRISGADGTSRFRPSSVIMYIFRSAATARERQGRFSTSLLFGGLRVYGTERAGTM